MKTIEAIQLGTITGGSTLARSSGSSATTQMQTALTGITSALDSLKQNQNTGMNQMLPMVIMAKWMQNR